MSKSKKKIDLSIVIPSYNEFKNLGSLFNKIKLISKKNKKIEIILVNNGSTDGTKNYLKSKKNLPSNIKIVNIKRNIGYGHGIISGLSKTSGKIVSWCHADLQFDLNDVVKAFKKYYLFLNSKKSIVKGRRQNRSFLDIFFTKGMAIFVNLVFKVKVDDINGQPKIFPRSLIKKLIKYAPKDFLLDLFFLLLISKKDYKIYEFPVNVKNRFKEQAKGGGSIGGKIKLTVNTLKYILFLNQNKSNLIWK